MEKGPLSIVHVVLYSGINPSYHLCYIIQGIHVQAPSHGKWFEEMSQDADVVEIWSTAFAQPSSSSHQEESQVIRLTRAVADPRCQRQESPSLLASPSTLLGPLA